MFYNSIWCQPNFMIISCHIHTQAWSKNIKFTNSYSSSDEITINKSIKGWGKRNGQKSGQREKWTEFPAGKSLSGSNTVNKICSVHHCITDKQRQWFKFPVTCQHGLFLSMIANRATDRQAPSCHTSYQLHVDLLQRFYHEEHVLTPHVCLLALF